ncbi:hypothetical protein ES703_118407 [subsurface metagenome]
MSGMEMENDEYTSELARVLREVLDAGAKRDFDRMLELAGDLEGVAVAGKEGRFGPAGGANEFPGDGTPG